MELKKVIQEAKDELSWIQQQIDRLDRLYDNLCANGVFWRAKQLLPELKSWNARKSEVEEFKLYLETAYQQEADSHEYQQDAPAGTWCSTCGLLVSKKHGGACMDCGRPCCLLHSLPQWTMVGKRRELLGRICDQCTEQE